MSQLRLRGCDGSRLRPSGQAQRGNLRFGLNQPRQGGWVVCATARMRAAAAMHAICDAACSAVHVPPVCCPRKLCEQSAGPRCPTLPHAPQARARRVRLCVYKETRQADKHEDKHQDKRGQASGQDRQSCALGEG